VAGTRGANTRDVHIAGEYAVVGKVNGRRVGQAINQYIAFHLALIEGQASTAVAGEADVAFQIAAVGKHDGRGRVIDQHVACHLRLVEDKVALAVICDIDIAAKFAAVKVQGSGGGFTNQHVARHKTMLEREIGRAVVSDVQLAFKRTADHLHRYIRSFLNVQQDAIAGKQARVIKHLYMRGHPGCREDRRAGLSLHLDIIKNHVGAVAYALSVGP
jgi:hypothetical protein